MPKAKDNSRPAPLPRVRALNDLRAIRVECAILYRQAKRGLIDPALFGRLVHCLSVLATITRDSDIEARLDRLEAAGEPSWQSPTNGTDRHAIN
jgi:hypothetical protein